MKKGLLLLAGMAMAATSAFAGVDTLYGIGQIEGWGNFASGSAGLELEKTADGVFTWSGKIEKTAYFGFASKLGSWDDVNSNRFSPSVKDALAVVGDNQMVANVDASWKINPGEYKFVIDTNTMIFNVTETAQVEKITTYAIHGQLDGLEDTDWATYPLTATEGNEDEWTAVITPTVSGGEFGAIQQINGAQSEWYAAGVSFDEDNTTFALTGDPAGNCTFDGAANKAYKFVFVPSTATLTITPDSDSAVAGIEADSNEAPVYYNMQGVRVANPEQGIFIVRQGSKVSKQVIR